MQCQAVEMKGDERVIRYPGAEKREARSEERDREREGNHNSMSSGIFGFVASTTA